MVIAHRLLIAAYLLHSTIALAQVDQEGRAGSDIIVTATPLGTGRAGPLAPQPGITDRDLKVTRATDVTDYLKRVTAGVFINEVQNNPLQPDVNYRGFTASPLLGTPQGLSVFLDGVRVNQPFGDVVSWDLIPTSAIASITLVPGSNPLFGRNSLGGALAIRTRDGNSSPGTDVDMSHGSFARTIARAHTGGKIFTGLNWFVSGDYFREAGWRAFSPSRALQGFSKLGWSDARTDVAVAGSIANTDLNGNGLQEGRLLAADRASVYTKPDNTRNRAWLLNATGTHRFSAAVSLAGNAFYRDIRTHTFNGDINDGSLGENLYQPNAAERVALAGAGISGVPLSGETEANTPFPRFRCIAEALLNTEPNEKCNGLINRSDTRQHEVGGSMELTLKSPVRQGRNVLVLGLSFVDGQANFKQSAQFAYLSADRGVVDVTGPGAFADGTQNSESAFDARVALTGRTNVFSAYVLDTIDATRTVQLDLSARYDRTDVRNRDGITPGGGSGSLDGDDRFQRLNPALSVRWSLFPAIGIYASVAQTSRAPSAIELGCADPASPCRLPNALAGDPPLKQVVATTGEGGISGSLHGITLRADVFRTTSRDDILFVANDQSGFGYFRNFGRTRRQGIDVDLAGAVGLVRLSGHYTLLDATYRSTERVNGSANSSSDAVAPGFDGNVTIVSGDRIPLIPRHIFKAAASWAPAKAVTLSADMIAVSGAFARGNENNQHRPDGVYYLGAGRTNGYAVVNGGIEIHAVRAVTIYAQMSNIFEKRYATAAQLGASGFDANGNFVARPFAAPVIGGERPLLNSTFYSPGAPRSVQVGTRIKF